MDATRDVLIRITTEVKSSIKAPDFGAIKTGHDEVKASADALAAAVANLEKVSKTESATVAQQVAALRALVEALPEESAERKVLAEEIEKTIALRKKEKEDADKKSSADFNFKAIAQLERLAAYRRKVAAEEEANQEKMMQAGRRAASQTGAAMAAMLQFGKGVALLSASTEEETKKIMKQIVVIQGFYDVAHGGVMMVSTLAGAWDAVTVAATAAGIAEYAALGPVIAVVATVAAGVYVLHEAFDIFQVKSREALEQGKKYGEWYMEFIKKASDMRTQLAGKQDSGLDTFAEHTISVRTSGMDDNADKLAEKAAIQDRLRAMTAEEIAMRKKEGFGYDERAEQLDKRLADQDEKRLAIQEEIVRGRKAELAATEQMLANAEKELTMAREKERSAEIALGHLTKGEQAQLKRLNDKVGRGEKLTDHELKMVAKLGGEGVRSFTDREYRKRGQAAGGLGLISNLGGADLKDKERQAAGEVDQWEADRQDMQKKLAEAEKKANEAAEDLAKSAKSAFDGMWQAMDHLRAEFKNQQQEARRRAMQGAG